MMSDIGVLYFFWLYDQAVPVRDPDDERSYVKVCEHLHSIAFNDRVPNDDNRTKEGIQLREEYLAPYRVTAQERNRLYDMRDEASLFEMMIALSRRADFYVPYGPSTWFEIFLKNLGLNQFSDPRYRTQDVTRINRILRRFNDRRYNAAGVGGIFPLQIPNHDQRHTELWYQMAAYMQENVMY